MRKDEVKFLQKKRRNKHYLEKINTVRISQKIQE